MAKQSIELKRIQTNPEIGLSDLQLQARIDAKAVNKTSFKLYHVPLNVDLY